MRQLAILGLLFSLLLGAVAVYETGDNVNSRRNAQDHSLQDAVGNEVVGLAGGQRQTMTDLSMMLVNPAVVQLLGDRRLSPDARRSDLAYTAASLATAERASAVPLMGACLDHPS